jgi:hypothetical protein
MQQHQREGETQMVSRERENKTTVAAVSCFLVTLLLTFVPAVADNWNVVYQTDFSADPGWTTNNAAHYSWNSATGSYYEYQKNGSEEYAFHTLSGLLTGEKRRLEFDVNPVSNGWAANISLGLYDSDMSTVNPCYTTLTFARIDAGLRLFLEWATASGSGQAEFSGPSFDQNQWYHGLLEWTPSTGTLYGRVTHVSDDSLVGEKTVTGLGLVTGIDRLAISTVDHTYASGAVAYGYIDNVVVSQTPEAAPVPEPVTMVALLGGIGCLGGYLRRRRR